MYVHLSPLIQIQLMIDYYNLLYFLIELEIIDHHFQIYYSKNNIHIQLHKYLTNLLIIINTPIYLLNKLSVHTIHIIIMLKIF